VRIGFDTAGSALGIVLGNTYDNEKYVTYVREDDYFLGLFNSKQLSELAVLDLEQEEVEGVSGATMTSMAVAHSVVAAAQQHQLAVQRAAERPPPDGPQWKWKMRDLGTLAVIVFGLVVAFSPLRGNVYARWLLQLVLVGYLGFINGDLVSQAMLVGWAKSGIPLGKAGGLVMLTAAALIVPITTRRNVYCSHLCPHGAAQQILRRRLKWQWRVPRKWVPYLKLVPGLLLGWCTIVGLSSLRFSLVDIEPFDAWVFRVAGWATITIAVVGLLAALFVPMAYCRYGCPTGALLGFLRFNTRSDQWSRRDWLAVGLMVLACGLFLAF